MKPYYQDESVTIYHGDCKEILPSLEPVDLVLTDPPYGISFMGKDWDKALPTLEIWQECVNILKPGAFAFVMSIPRSDCLSRMIISLEDAGLRVDFTPIYWAYASGFPKAQNIGKAVDKRLGAEREVIGKYQSPEKTSGESPHNEGVTGLSKKLGGLPNITLSATPQAKALDGSYGGFQPKPAVEVIIVAMRPLSEKTFVDQALKHGKGVTWLDDGRIPYESDADKEFIEKTARPNTRGICNGNDLYSAYKTREVNVSLIGRFPANLLVSNDVLNDGINRQSGKMKAHTQRSNRTGYTGLMPATTGGETIGDTGSFSRYFDLDKWAQTLPFLIVPKASKSEKGKDCTHPTVKPLKLMSYLAILGSREGDTILDPFVGSGTTALACKMLGRKCIGIEVEERYCEIAAKRCEGGS